MKRPDRQFRAIPKPHQAPKSTLSRALNPVDCVVVLEQACDVQEPQRALKDGNGAICVVLIAIVIVIVITITIKLLKTSDMGRRREQARMPSSD